MTVAVLGEALIDFIVGEDGAYRPHLGGSPYNVAIGLARQGVPVRYVSPLSDDSFGDQLHASLQREGVEIGIVERSRKPTSLALVTLDQARQPTYRLYREGIADKDVTFEQVEAAHIQRVLDHTDGHKGRSCKILGISRPALDRKILKYGLQVPGRG